MIMISRLIDNILALDNLNKYAATIVQVLVVFIWFFITGKLKNSYRAALVISLTLISFSVIAYMVTFTEIAGIIGEYAFLFLGIGIIQSFFAKEV